MCPFDCSGNGKCVNGGCECGELFVGVDCSQRYMAIWTNEHKGLLVPSKGYVLFKSLYDSNQNLGLSLTVLQGEAVALVSYGR